MMLLSPLSARIISRHGARNALMLGCVVLAGGYLLRLGLSEHLWQVLVATTVASAGGANAFSAMPALILVASPKDEAAAATGLNTLARGIGTSASSACATALLGAIAVTVSGGTYPARTAYLVFFVSAAGAAFGSALITSRYRIPASSRAGQPCAAQRRRLLAFGVPG